MAFTDRSRIELDWTCPRARYYAYEWEGVGLAPMETPKELNFGLLMAEQTANIKQGKPWTTEKFVGEEQKVANALLIGYETIVWPRFLRDYDLVSIEEEQPFQLTESIIYNSRPDAITRRKSDGTLWYGPEDKTTAYLDSLLNYAGNVQLHATAKCIEHNKGERVAGCLVQGLYKGFEKEGKLYHSLVYGYVKEGRAGIIPDQWSVKWVRGWERETTERFPGGVREWIKQRTAEEIASVFPNSQPITPNRGLVEKYFEQVRLRENRVEVWRQAGRNENELDYLFPQHFNQCDAFSKGRKPCVFKEMCFNPMTRRFPMTFYKKRVPHHTNELEVINGSRQG